MGMVFGKITVETPNHETIHKTPDYEIRKYPPSILAETTYDPSTFNSDKDGGFQILANYIGAFGKPQNKSPEQPISMTAPVITKSVPISMTAPVITKERKADEMVSMSFILPSKYRKIEDVPKPVDERVIIREEGERKYGVLRFSGVASEGLVKEKVGVLKGFLERDGFKVVGDFVLGRYNPPWTLPMFRTNEIYIPVE